MFIHGILKVVIVYTFTDYPGLERGKIRYFGEGILHKSEIKHSGSNIAIKREIKRENDIYTLGKRQSFIKTPKNLLKIKKIELTNGEYSLEGDSKDLEEVSGESEWNGRRGNTNTDLDEWNDYKLIDFCEIKVQGGRGGDGCLSFRREKHVPLGGANGGNGGPGGNVYIKCDEKTNDLRWFDNKRFYKADDGENGMGSKRNGAKGKDLYLYVPPGTQVTGDNEEVYVTLVKDGDKIRIARGGRGGKGNRHYVTRLNTAPRICERGEEGTSRNIKLIYKKSSDIALIGKPNSGKSSIIKALTNARPRIANFPFSTRFPIHGVMDLKEEEQQEEGQDNRSPENIENSNNDSYVKNYYEDYDYDEEEAYDSSEEEYAEEPLFGEQEYNYGDDDDEVNWGMRNENEPEYESEMEAEVELNKENGLKPNQLLIADIPGLIDGSSQGRGLGHDFLRHIERCQIISYVIDSSVKDPVADYLDVRRELEMYNPNLLTKMDLILLNKIDLIDNDKISKLSEEFLKVCNHDRIFFLSAKTRENLEVVSSLFAKIHSENNLKNKKSETEKILEKIDLDNFRNLNPKRFRVEKEVDGTFRVISPYLERKVKMMRFDLPETVDRLRNFLKVNRIKKKLVKLGLKEGDTVNIGEMSFRVESDEFFV